MLNISGEEKNYIKQGLETNIRSDGRSLTDIRPILVEKDIFPHVNGSSRIVLGNRTDVVCSVKVYKENMFCP